MHKSPFSDFLLCQLPWANPSKLASVMKRWTIAGRQKRGTEGFLHLRYFALRYFHAKSEDGKTSKYVSFFLLRTWFWLESSRNWQDEELERQVKSRNWSWLPDSLMLLACKFWIIIALLLQSFALPNSSGKVNLKHLLWQLREQQSALSAVTELRQEAPWGQRTLRSAVVNVFSLRFFGHEISMCFVCFAAWNDSQVLSLKLSYNAAKADFQSEICGTTWHESWNNGRNIKPSKLVFWCLWSCQAEFQPVKEDIETIRETIKKAWFVSWCSENPADLLLAHLSTRFT